tara:strand:- start:589 stop:837 length:249 start_codon:yes stop_codon:yes gene_type:complete
MKNFLLTIYFIQALFMMKSFAIADHANEPYCFDCMHKYKIGDKKNENFYKFESNLQDNNLSYELVNSYQANFFHCNYQALFL